MARVNGVRRSVAAALVAAVAVALPLVGGADAAPGDLEVRWDAGGTSSPAGSVETGHVRLGSGPSGRLGLVVTGGRFLRVPTPCVASSVIAERSSLDQPQTTLRCEVRAGTDRVVPFVVEVGSTRGVQLRVTARFAGREDVSPWHVVGVGPGTAERRLRLLSSPDFTNADIADLRRGPSSWRPGRSENSVNPAYRKALDVVLDDWQAADPDGVLVAGDLVDGRWGADAAGTGNFGPVRTLRERKRALKRAAATYYPQWLERFTQRGLPVHTAAGDHEYGDNPWPAERRALAKSFEKAYGRWIGRTRSGHLRYADHPSGPHAASAYAFRPHPDVQVVTINPFDITKARVRIGLDPAQRRWLQGVLAQAQADGVRWTIVQGHTPVLWPVRTRGSSALHYPGGAGSDLWRLFERYGVDLYLSGEVHDITLKEHGGVTQVSHGGLFQFGLTNYLLVDVYDDRLELALRDFRAQFSDAADGSRLWETRGPGMPKKLKVAPDPHTIGTAVVTPGGLADSSGVLLPPTGR
ncbi:metallophosphoesterase [Nocardioides sp. SYSU D00038]|uniref:metallophosphoesterase family protein n=1 Tax=Nocardioides sp. SYSU D00038 TaxID=2812554 RepID=UPI0019679FDA|nr:metallophosphoesterase [Nocardioides sp. SYSU D00038]